MGYCNVAAQCIVFQVLHDGKTTHCSIGSYFNAFLVLLSKSSFFHVLGFANRVIYLKPFEKPFHDK